MKVGTFKVVNQSSVFSKVEFFKSIIKDVSASSLISMPSRLQVSPDRTPLQELEPAVAVQEVARFGSEQLEVEVDCS